MIWDEINRKSFYKYYRLVDPGSIQGSHRPVVSREEMYLTITSWNIATQLAKMNIDRLGEFTADVFLSLLLIYEKSKTDLEISYKFRGKVTCGPL